MKFDLLPWEAAIDQRAEEFLKELRLTVERARDAIDIRLGFSLAFIRRSRGQRQRYERQRQRQRQLEE